MAGQEICKVENGKPWGCLGLRREEPRLSCGPGKTCRQRLDADGSPVQMLSVFLQQVKLTLDQWSIGGDKTNKPGSLKEHLAELLAA